jgi:phage I-like protein
MSAPLHLLASTSITLDASGAMPTRLKLLAWGANETGGKGTFLVNETTLAQLAANQKASNFDTVAFDFEHNTVKGSPNYAGEPCKVAGHGTPLVLSGEGLFLDAIEWTKEGKEFVGGRHYIDVSPSILTSPKGEVIFLHSAAACRQGATVGATITLSADINSKLQPSMFDPKKFALEILGLPETATDSEMQAAADSFRAFLTAEKVTTLSGIIPALKTLAAKPDSTSNVQSELATLKASIEKLTNTSVEKERATLLTAAAAAGKVIPDALKTADLTILSAAIDAIQPSVPLTKHTVTVQGGGVVTLSAEALSVAKQLGITPEEMAAIK